MDKILTLLDGSAYSESVCHHTAWIAQKLNAGVVAMHVLGREAGASSKDLSGALRLGARTALLEELSALDQQRARLAQAKGHAILEDAKGIIEQDGVRVALNTMNANRIVREALESRAIGGFGEYDRVLPEVRIDSSTRLDFALQHEDAVSRYIEVKNVSWNRDGIGAFPDAVTKRGAKHLRTLADLVRKGHRAVLLFVAQRGDIQRLAIAGDIDPDYLQAFREAIGAGVECVAFNCTVNEIEIRLAARMEVAL